MYKHHICHAKAMPQKMKLPTFCLLNWKHLQRVFSIFFIGYLPRSTAEIAAGWYTGHVTPNGAVMSVPHVTNEGVEPRNKQCHLL